MGCRVEILPEKYSRITTDTLVLKQRNIEADLQNQKGVWGRAARRRLI